jgi:3-oxoacyl-[acyl-carrier-protein] synthase II
MLRTIQQRRVVVTGLGMMCPVGNTVEEAWGNAAAGVSGIAPIQRFDTSHLRVHFGGEVKNFNPADYLDNRTVRRTDRVTHMALVAAREAIEDAKLEVTDENAYDIGCLVGSGIGGLETIVASTIKLMQSGVRTLSPFIVPMTVPDGACSQISIDFGLRGPVFSISTACATGNNSIGEATEIIRRGSAKVMVAGSSEAGLVDVSIASFDNMTALSRRNDTPEKASRPFDRDRDGFVVGEGAGVLVLEELEHALERGARIYAEVLGYGHTSDAYHVTAPMESGDSAARAIQIALRDAGLTPSDVDYINAHGTSTPLNDKTETLAIKQAFGEEAYNVHISSTKSVTGHLMAGAGSVEAIFAIKALENNFIPPTINLENPDPDCDLNYTPNVGVETEVNVVMNNSFGFGGHNAVLIFGRYKL